MFTSYVPFDQTIFLVPNQGYRMYYNDNVDGKLGVASATSADGKTWFRDPGVRTQRSGSLGHLQLSDGRLRLYIGGLDIDSAISRDGFTFTAEPALRQALGGDLDSAAAFAPDVVRLPDGRYRMYYTGRAGSDQYPGGVMRILSSISPEGFTFTREPGARIDGVPAGEPNLSRSRVVRQADGSYAMYFSNGTLLHSAVSSDGLTFKRMGSTGALGSSASLVTMHGGRLQLLHAYSSAQCGNLLFSSVQTKVPWKLAVSPDKGVFSRTDLTATFNVEVTGVSASPIRLDAGPWLLCDIARRPQATVTMTPTSGKPPFTAKVQVSVDQVSAAFRQDVPFTVRATDGTLTQTFTVIVGAGQ